jgi:hypothetical protein
MDTDYTVPLHFHGRSMQHGQEHEHEREHEHKNVLKHKREYEQT